MRFNYSIRRLGHRRLWSVIEACAILAAVSAVIAAGWYYYYRNSPEDITKPVSSHLTTTVDQANLRSFETPYFRFEAPAAWQQDKAASGPNQYVYRAYDNDLVEQDLTIYVNAGNDLPAVTRILPVSIVDNHLVAKGPISAHCRQQLDAATKTDTEVTHSGVRLLCDSDGTLFNVAVGLNGGSTMLTLPHPVGAPSRLVIVYRDLRFNPHGRDLTEIVNSLESF